MEAGLALLVGLFLAAGIYMLLSRVLIRILLGFVLFGNGVNLMILTAGRLTREVPPIVPAGLDMPLGPVANPLPHALILTAIVIGFAMFTFLLVLAYRAHETLGVEDTGDLRLSEPGDGPNPPHGY